MNGRIVFSHGNSFPAGTYRKLFELWRAEGWQVHAHDKFGHDPAYPVTDNWPHLRDELLAFLAREAPGPAVLVGHSLGGFLSVMAAAAQPEKVQAVVLLDTPVIAGWRAKVLHVGKRTGLVRHYSPSAVARLRRQQWADARAAFDHFAGKASFARWDPQVLRDYIDEGTHPRDGARWLSFRREVEADIYDTLPHHLPQLLRAQPLQCPLAFIGGTQSTEVGMVGMQATQSVARGGVSWIEGSHLFPMERPTETAQRVLQVIAGLNGAARVAA